MSEGEVEVWHDTEREYLEQILRTGLKPGGKAPPEHVDKCAPQNKMVDKVAEEGSFKKVSRCDSSYGYLPDACPMPIRDKVTLAVKVDPKKCYVGDMSEITVALGAANCLRAIEADPAWASRFFDPPEDYREKMKTWTRFYHAGMVTLEEYLRNPGEHEFTSPEVIIPFDVPPEKLRVVEPCK